jgi:hypothetical protein
MTRGNCEGQSRGSPHSWGERWTKVYKNALTDTKYLAIADKTGAPRLLIGATFTELLLSGRPKSCPATSLAMTSVAAIR